IRKEILEGSTALSTLLDSEAPGQIKAHIIERDGKILMVKDCPKHGHFEDVISTDPDFSRHLEQTFPGRDIRAHNDGHVHHHGVSRRYHRIFWTLWSTPARLDIKECRRPPTALSSPKAPSFASKPPRLV